MRSPWIWTAIVFTLLAVGAQFLPLTRELHYELSAVAALWTSLGAGIAALLAWPRGRDDEPVRSTTGALGAALLTTFPPLLVSLVHGVAVGFCGIVDGLRWYALLVPASAVIAVAVARLARAITLRRWLQIVLYLALWSVPMARGAFEALTGPHIFLYAWQVGFFPGGSWDPELPITPLLLVHRTTHVLLASLLLFVLLEIEDARAGRRRRGHALVLPAALAAAVALALFPQRTELGLTRTDAWLRAELGDSVRTRHATIYYDATTTDSLDIWRAANYTDFYVRRQALALGMEPADLEPITFYAYASSSEQKRLVGTSSASYTKPWRRTLNLAFDRVEATLEHELAHIVLEPYGNLLCISWSNGILEGSAVALEHADNAAMLHRHARAAYDAGLAPPVSRIMGMTGFASQRASLSYMLAGSFCRWLLDTYGARPFLRAYASGDLDEYDDNGIAVLEARYREFLERLPPTDSASFTTVRYLYGGGSFFAQRCLRRLATLTGKGYRALGEERYEEALDAFRASLEEGITAGARGGIIRTLHASGRYGALVDSMGIYVGRDSLGVQLLPYQVELADALGMLDRPGRAATLMDVMRTAGDEWTRARAAMRLALADDDAPDTSRATPDSGVAPRAMLEYFARPMSLTARVVTLERLERRAAPGDPPKAALLRLMRAGQIVRSQPLLAAEVVAGDSTVFAEHARQLDTASAASARQIDGFARSALLRTLLDAHLMRIWSDGRTGNEERRTHLRLLEEAYRYVVPLRRTAVELVTTERPRETHAAFATYLAQFGAIAPPRARR